MVTDAIITVFSYIAAGIAKLMPALPLPAYLTGTGPGTLVGQLGSAVASMGSLDAWLPSGQIIGAALLVVAALTAAVAIRVARMVLATLHLGGQG